MTITDEFLRVFLREKPLDQWFHLWTLQDSESYWFQDIDLAAQEAQEMAHKDIYIGMALCAQRYSDKQRATHETASGILGMWADLDVETDGHHKDAKSRLAPDIDSALELIDHLPKPNIIINSGGGVHVYWLLKDAWIFQSDEERDEAHNLIQRWQQSIRKRFNAKGWKMDATADLPRILRLPGTWNHKTEPPKPVTIHTMDDSMRYSERAFHHHVRDEKIAKPRKTRAIDAPDGDIPAPSGAFVMNASASPPLEKYMELMKRRKFKQTWDMKRADLTDQSPSQYDISLADMAAAAGWNDQEIVDLLICWRRMHNIDAKLRLDYYQMQLDSARMFVEQRTLPMDGDDVAPPSDAGDDATPIDDRDATDEDDVTATRCKKFKFLHARLGIRIVKIEKYLTDPPQYHLHTEKGRIDLGDVSNLISQGKFRNMVAAAAGHVIPKHDAPDWQPIAQALCDVCEEVAIGEGTIRGRMQSILRDYLTENPPLTDAQRDRAAVQKSPCFIGTEIAIHLSSLLAFYNAIYDTERATIMRLGIMMRQIGARDIVVKVKIKNKPTTNNVWMLPDWVTLEEKDDGE